MQWGCIWLMLMIQQNFVFSTRLYSKNLYLHSIKLFDIILLNCPFGYLHLDIIIWWSVFKRGRNLMKPFSLHWFLFCQEIHQQFNWQTFVKVYRINMSYHKRIQTSVCYLVMILLNFLRQMWLTTKSGGTEQSVMVRKM